MPQDFSSRSILLTVEKTADNDVYLEIKDRKTGGPAGSLLVNLWKDIGCGISKEKMHCQGHISNGGCTYHNMNLIQIKESSDGSRKVIFGSDDPQLTDEFFSAILDITRDWATKNNIQRQLKFTLPDPQDILPVPD